MYLKKIIATGFKSFADKTILELSEGITGIVGPNGSGKSNVVDAVRWVLGEQSVKSLRGDGNMTDVIFSGSKSRNSMNMASVTLVFDNKDHYLNLDFTEVSIRRRVYNDGTNEYSINDEKCRLKDVVDLFLDSGASKESFNIISQGKVEEIISSKPENRRSVFEEAAGVIKYRKRKEEALRKLEKTHENLERVNDIRTELASQVEPLRLQREKALIYKEKMESLENVEVALMASDIKSLNEKFKIGKEKIDKLNKEIMESSTSTSSKEAEILSLKQLISKEEIEITEKTNELITLSNKVEQANSRKNMLKERQKYEVEDTKLHENIISLKENEKKLELDETKTISSIEDTKESLELNLKEIESLEKNFKNLNNNKQNLNNTLSLLVKENYSLKTKINTLKENIENNSSTPTSVKSVLNNIKLSGIHDTIGNIIEIKDTYVTAITTSLSSALNYVVVEDELKAKEAIKYLKENKQGRVTFFPLSIIKGRTIDNALYNDLKKQIGFIDIASNLVNYNPLYKNIIENQLGNVLIVDNIDNANKISKYVNYKYKIVTLDGTLLHVGGSLTGGSIYKQRSIITDKQELEETLKKLDYNELNLKEIENKINECDYELKSIEDKVYISSKKKIELSESLARKQNSLDDIRNGLRSIKLELEGTSSIKDNTLSLKEEEALNEYYDLLKQKEELTHNLELLKEKRNLNNMTLEEKEFESRKENSITSSKTKELQSLEIEQNRMDVKLDTLLTKLNETYAMTYEFAEKNYTLELDVDTSREYVSKLKQEIKELGEINMLAVEEYEKVNERYTFLQTQEEDLLKAEDTLLSIINEMDQVMIKEFSNTFEVIRKNFTQTFKELFHGGNADLKLTDPTNMLETGIEIVASPPGKTLKTISFLSGGEKTFTAISLLFAILKSRPVPYCILDEVEAALDEVNVDSFGEYLKTLKEKTQFILITHKKKTMEYADFLYGITMQESGVSKVVSVKLEEVKNG